jgi:large subunit ribosomal protein L19
VDKFPSFRTGDTIQVFSKIREGAKTRLQAYEGIVIDIKRRTSTNGHFCVRKMTAGIGVERDFPFHSPNIDSIKIVLRGKTRQSKLYYLRDREGKSARVAIDYDRD